MGIADRRVGDPGLAARHRVQTTSGEIMHADLVVDAMGRRSHAGEWIKAVGGRSPHEEHEDNTFLYYTRYFTGPRRPRRLGRALTPMGIFSTLTLDGDNVASCR